MCFSLASSKICSAWSTCVGFPVGDSSPQSISSMSSSLSSTSSSSATTTSSGTPPPPPSLSTSAAGTSSPTTAPTANASNTPKTHDLMASPRKNGRFSDCAAAACPQPPSGLPRPRGAVF